MRSTGGRGGGSGAMVTSIAAGTAGATSGVTGSSRTGSGLAICNPGDRPFPITTRGDRTDVAGAPMLSDADRGTAPDALTLGGSSTTAADRNAVGSSTTAADRNAVGSSTTAADRNAIGSSTTAADRNAIGPSGAMLCTMARSSRSLPPAPRSITGGARDFPSPSAAPMTRTSFTKLGTFGFGRLARPLEPLFRSSFLECEPEPFLSASACAGLGPTISRDAATTPAPAARRIVDCATIPSQTFGFGRTQRLAQAFLHIVFAGQTSI